MLKQWTLQIRIRMLRMCSHLRWIPIFRCCCLLLAFSVHAQNACNCKSQHKTQHFECDSWCECKMLWAKQWLSLDWKCCQIISRIKWPANSLFVFQKGVCLFDFWMCVRELCVTWFCEESWMFASNRSPKRYCTLQFWVVHCSDVFFVWEQAIIYQ